MMVSQKPYEEQYLDIAQDILDKGYYSDNRTGIPTYKLPHQIIQVDLQKEFPILTTKFVAFKTAVKELLWIMNGNNSVEDLKAQNVNIWNEWEKEDGTVGTCYGWVIKQYDQINKLIKQLRTDDQDRGMIISLWQIEHLAGGSLRPCVWSSEWDVTDNRLNCKLNIRSNDFFLGGPFNHTQYAVLVHLLSQITGHEPGLLTICISNAHIYENHVVQMKEQLSKRDKAYPMPKLWINPDIKEFKDFTIDDIKLIDYKHHDKIKADVAV